MNIRQGQWVYLCRTLSGLLDICIWEWDGHFNSSYSKVILRLSTFEFCSRKSKANQRRPGPCWSSGRRTSTSRWERLKTPQPLSRTSDLSSWKGWAEIVTKRSGLKSQWSWFLLADDLQLEYKNSGEPLGATGSPWSCQRSNWRFLDQ